MTGLPDAAITVLLALPAVVALAALFLLARESGLGARIADTIVGVLDGLSGPRRGAATATDDLVPPLNVLEPVTDASRTSGAGSSPRGTGCRAAASIDSPSCPLAGLLDEAAASCGCLPVRLPATNTAGLSMDGATR